MNPDVKQVEQVEEFLKAWYMNQKFIHPVIYENFKSELWALLEGKWHEGMERKKIPEAKKDDRYVYFKNVN